jgi:FkbM family methyltransferase
MKKIRYISKEHIAHSLPKNPIIVEAGGHTGRDAIQMARYWPDGHIHTFEPVPQLFNQLVKNCAPYRNITAYNYALSDASGTSTMNISSASCDAVSSLLKPKLFLESRPDVTFIQEPVHTITLDDWAQSYGIPQVDFLWLDLQGYELFALQSAKRLLSNVKAIHTEVSLTERYASNPLYHELKEWLEFQDFFVQTEALYRITWGNVLFVKHLVKSP